MKRTSRTGMVQIRLLAFAIIFALGQPLFGQSKTSPESQLSSTSEALESHPITPSAAEQPDSKLSQSAAPAGAFDATRVLLSLVGVIGLILLLRLAAKRFFPGAITHRASSAVKILARCPVSPRQNLLVVQFGKRLVLVGDSGSSLNPLCEINDADEVTSILTQARDESITAARRFDSLFGRARKGFGAESPESAAEESFDESSEIPGAPADPSIESTRKELSGLTEKVRDLARQIGGA